MTVRNRMDRFHLVMDVIERVKLHSDQALDLREQMEKKLIEHENYINKHGVDMPEVQDWKWEF